MAFSIRPYPRFAVCCPVTYQAGLCQGHGIVWNVSMKGWRLAGDVPLQVGETCLLNVHLPSPESLIIMVAAIVRWGKDWDQEYGLETLMVSKETQSQLEQVLTQLETASFESIE